MSIRVLIADDQPLARAGLRMIVESQPDIAVVGEATGGADACDRATALQPDIVLMDVRMPGVDGIAATRQILSAPAARRPRVIVLTTFDLDEYVYDALRAGASAFLLKDTEPRLIIEAIRAVAAGEALLSPQVTRRLIERFVRLPERVVEEAAPPVDPIAGLTARQREVLTLVGRGMTNSEIAAAMVIVEATVKTHVSNVFARLGIRDRAQAVIVAYETGLIHPGERPVVPGG
jgi:DNA-binding NarL/FixJ family response regulator